MDEIIKVNDVSMRFNLAQEKTETLKEYTVKLLKHQLFFNEFYALQDVSFSIEPGESVALIGRNGSGKSTIVNLLPRFYDASEGQVLVDGVDVKEYREKSLNDKLGYVPQKSLLFFGSVKDNIVYGSEGKISDEKVEEALKVAQADFVFGLPV